MNQQLSFLEPMPKARRTDPQTSKDAALSAKSVAHQHQVLILGALRQGPAGVDLIASRTRLSSHQIGKRMHELKEANAAKPTGRTVTGLSGRSQREWAITAKALQP